MGKSDISEINMNILFLTIGDMEISSGGGIYADLLREFNCGGHHTVVVCPENCNSSFSGLKGIEGTIKILRVKTGHLTKTGLVRKGIATLMIQNQYLKAIKKQLPHYSFDLIIFSTPPITFRKIVDFVKKRDQARTYLLLKDIFPQNAVDLGMFSKNSLFYFYFRNIEKKLYRTADYIGCMSAANVRYLLDKNPFLEKEKVEVCPNSISPMSSSLEEDVEQTKKSYGIPSDKVVLVYGGNLGKPQGIDFLMDILKVGFLKENIYTLIVGSGTEYEKLERYFIENGPENAKLLRQLPRKDYEKLVRASDIGLILLDKRFTIPNFPSRILSYMQASIPVLAATDLNTDIGKIIEDGEFGYWVEHGDLDTFLERIKKLLDPELRKKMGVNARRYLEEHYTAKHSYEVIMKHFKK